MISLQQMERYVQLMDVIDLYRQKLAQNGLHAAAWDGSAGNHSPTPDKTGEIVAQRERARRKLSELEALAAQMRPEVEKMIKAAATLQTRGAVKIELALRARYLSGRSWPEIADLLHVQNPAQIAAAALRRLEEVEENI